MSDLRTTTLSFQRGAASAEEIEAVAIEAVTQYRSENPEGSDPTLDQQDLDGLTISVVEDSQGVEPILTTIIVGITVKAGAAIATQIWNKYIWPRIAKQLGIDAVGEPKEQG